jgi:hypothetical protein
VTLSRTTIQSRAAAVRSALSRADVNHDGKLSRAEQARASRLVSGPANGALQQTYTQTRQRSGFVSVASARRQVSTAERAALGADRNRNGLTAAERARLGSPVARALTQGATGSSPVSAAASSASTSAGGIRVTTTMKRLARNAVAVANGMGGSRSQGLCATGVSRNIARSMGLSVHGNGNQIDNNLPRSRFKQLHIGLAQALKIPGLVLTWEHTSSRLGSRYGHTAVTLGNGRGSASDFIERNTLGAGGRSGLKIFLPLG